MKLESGNWGFEKTKKDILLCIYNDICLTKSILNKMIKISPTLIRYLEFKI